MLQQVMQRLDCSTEGTPDELREHARVAFEKLDWDDPDPHADSSTLGIKKLYVKLTSVMEKNAALQVC